MFKFVFILLQQQKNLKFHEKAYENKDFCGIAMPSEKDNILHLINIQNQIKFHTLFMLTLICKQSRTIKIRLAHSLPIFKSEIWAFDHIENKHI